jgi:hypothetical protein
MMKDRLKTPAGVSGAAIITLPPVRHCPGRTLLFGISEGNALRYLAREQSFRELAARFSLKR